MYKIEFYVPSTHLETVKDALFEAGAGAIGHYDRCCWQIEGTGQFRPSEESHPHIGERGRLETLKEWKVEMVCRDELLRRALLSFLKAHPYEEPAYNLVKVTDKSMFL